PAWAGDAAAGEIVPTTGFAVAPISIRDAPSVITNSEPLIRGITIRMAARIDVGDGIVYHIAVPVARLGIRWVRHDGIFADQSPNLWVVVARIVVVEPKLLIVLLRRKLVRYCVKARRIAGRNLAKREMNDSCLLAVAGRC